MKKIKLLHITPWYPSDDNPLEAIWIKRHIESLGDAAENDILHLQLKDGAWSYSHTVQNELRRVILHTPIKSWFVKEIIASIILLLILLVHYTGKRYALWNFHIAYPNLVYLSHLKSLFRVPFLITEHWSYYHFHFYSNKKLKRVKSIFSRGIPLITVSKALQDAITKFCGFEVNSEIIPNVIDDSFHFRKEIEKSEHFLMVAFWKDPKQPLKIIEAIAELKKKGHNLKLKIGGYGPLLDSVQQKVNELRMEGNIELIGRLDAEDLAIEMNRCKAFIIPTKYETFSVICAEALCCGTVVLADSVGALTELIQDGDGVLVKDDKWEEALTGDFNGDHPAISNNACKRFSREVVASKYLDCINQIIHKTP